MTIPSKRLLNIALGLDESLNAVFGGRPQESVSGTIGRALLAKAWWAPAAAWIVNGLLGPTHCQTAATVENARREADAKAGDPL